MKTKKSIQLLFIALMVFMPTVASAYIGEVVIGGINYYINTDGETAEVRIKYSKYSGDVVIPETVEYEGVTCRVTGIGEYAFYDCSSLTSITIPNFVTSIGGAAFAGCSSLTSITIPNSVTNIGGSAFYACKGLTSFTIPSSVTSIEVGEFMGCSSLTSVTIPNSVTNIGTFAFYDCPSLTSITIPSSVTSIGGWAFANCAELANVYCYAEETPYTIFDAFNGSEIKYATLHVPDASVEEYKSTSPWSEFGTIVGLSDSETAIVAKQLQSLPVLIQAEDGQFSVEGAPEDTKIAVYDASGVEVGTAISCGGKTLVPTHLPQGSIAIVKIGEKAVKVAVK